MIREAIRPRAFSKSGAALYLGCSVRTIERYIKAGKLHTRRIPHPSKENEYLEKVIIPIEELDRLFSEGVEI